MAQDGRRFGVIQKRCRWCGETKRVSDFGVTAAGWIVQECKACESERLRCWAQVERVPVIAPGERRWVDAQAAELVCTRCGRMRQKDAFYTFKDGRSERRHYRPKCKQCMGAEKNLRKRSPFPEQKRREKDRRLRREFGIPLAEYELQLDVQDGRCAICCTTDPGGPTEDAAFHVDHDHESKRVRGLLCRSCNTGLGLFGDDPNRLLAAVTYLWEARRVDWEPGDPLRPGDPGWWPGCADYSPGDPAVSADAARYIPEEVSPVG